MAAVLVGLVVPMTGGCEREAVEGDVAKLATFDSILAELGGSATAALDRGQRWRMISSTGAGLPPTAFDATLLPEREAQGARLLQVYCVQCHGLPVPHMHTAEEWPTVLRRMYLRTETLRRHMGGRVTERLLGEMRMVGMAAVDIPSHEEQDSLIAYLIRHAFPGLERSELPEGPGKTLFLERCGTCHMTPDPAAHTLDEWGLILARMQGNMAAMDVRPVSEEERESLLRYLEAAGAGSGSP